MAGASGQTNELQWEVSAGAGPDNLVCNYLCGADDAVDFCGRLLYGNTIFPVLYLSVRNLTYDPKGSGPNPERPDGTTSWVMRTVDKDGRWRERRLATKHELFAMLVAEVALGKPRIRAWRAGAPDMTPA